MFRLPSNAVLIQSADNSVFRWDGSGASPTLLPQFGATNVTSITNTLVVNSRLFFIASGSLHIFDESTGEVTRITHSSTHFASIVDIVAPLGNDVLCTAAGISDSGSLLPQSQVLVRTQGPNAELIPIGILGQASDVNRVMGQANVLSERVVFWTARFSTPNMLWGFDPTNNHLELLASFSSSQLFTWSSATYQGQLYFSVPNSGLNAPSELWHSDGTRSGTGTIAVPDFSLEKVIGSTSRGLLLTNGALSDDGVYSVLEPTTGTLTSLRLGSSVLPPRFAVNHSGQLVMLAPRGTSNVWIRTDGSSGNSTVLISNLAFGRFTLGSLLFAKPVREAVILAYGTTGISNSLYWFDPTSPGNCIDGVVASSPISPVQIISDLVATPSRSIFLQNSTGRTFPVSIDLCPPDFNNSGGAPNAQDVFDFLAAFFAASPAADFNASGGSPTVQDVFDFIAAWFRGC